MQNSKIEQKKEAGSGGGRMEGRANEIYATLAFSPSLYLSIYLSFYLAVFLPFFLSSYLSVFLPFYRNPKQKKGERRKKKDR